MILLSLIAHLLAVASPGPDTFIVMRQTIASGFKAGLSSAVGIGLGILIHCSLALYGLSALILSDPIGSYIPYIGSIYLFFWVLNQLLQEISPSKIIKTPWIKDLY